jgi:transposase-like protein
MKTYIKNQLISQKLNMIKEYGRIKKKKCKYFKTVKEMCKFYGISRKTFYKWLNRYNKSNKDPNSLLPQSTRPKTIRKRT